MDYLSEIVGHPYQLQPSHIVVTSKYFDTREVTVGRGAASRKTERIDRIALVIRLREDGALFKDIAEVVGVSEQAVCKMYRCYKGE
jgi:hypothetical protein